MCLLCFQVIRDEDLESERAEWVQWLENEEVPSDVRKREVCDRDKKGLGWSALHHAARHGRTEILGCAADVEGGIFTYMYVILMYVHVSCRI